MDEIMEDVHNLENMKDYVAQIKRQYEYGVAARKFKQKLQKQIEQEESRKRLEYGEEGNDL